MELTSATHKLTYAQRAALKRERKAKWRMSKAGQKHLAAQAEAARLRNEAHLALPAGEWMAMNAK